ncbi:putative peptidoglycan binding protein [Tamaricihabitans halophyticus]|uniref:Putative peptidoglycan binding protein n=1 Tax=Tamaricihabitans halophyticus TaxID=1262583 RepID=A0A4R2QMY6_9PSEU|nr:transglycosylase family protein [Tamaricihabitans halophyticus]TCP50940.1 putative peptidoglycan binding protein [Tamaricihabitans halophyticus]
MTKRQPGRVLRTITRIALIALVAGGAQLTLSGVAAADPPSSSWEAVRMCESSGNYSINTGNGYYGAYQFDLPTWQSVGGTGYPSEASPAEQDYRALYLYRMRGWQPWECAGMLGLADDGDGRSKVVPSYDDSAYIGGSGSPAPKPKPEPAPKPQPKPDEDSGAMPEWPGLVYAYGDCSPELRKFQLKMNDYGYDFEGTGCYYDETKEAVLDVQRANDIRDSGRLGPKTWKAGWEGEAPR